MTSEEASLLISQDEGQTVEFKKSFAEQNEAIKSLCAFANANGGTVFLGITPGGNIAGVSLGANTLENFSNEIKANTQPPLYPTIDLLTIEGNLCVAVTVAKAGRGQLHYAFNVPYVRVGRANQVMSPDTQRAKLLAEQDDSSADRDRARFHVR